MYNGCMSETNAGCYSIFFIRRVFREMIWWWCPPPKKNGGIDIDRCWLLTINHAVESIPNLTSWAMKLMISIKWVKQWSIAKRGQLAWSTRCKSGLSKVFISNLEPVIGRDMALHSWALLNTPVKKKKILVNTWIKTSYVINSKH